MAMQAIAGRYRAPGWTGPGVLFSVPPACTQVQRSSVWHGNSIRLSGSWPVRFTCTSFLPCVRPEQRACFQVREKSALAVAEAILRALGATPDQIDRERARVHADLFDSPT